MELKFWACYGIAIMVLAALTPEGSAQDSSCLNELAPCLNYLNGGQDPPDSCCDPLKSVIKSNPECLCSMISTRGTNQARQAGINVTEAQQLPGKCGQHVNPLSCLSSMHLISLFTSMFFFSHRTDLLKHVYVTVFQVVHPTPKTRFRIPVASLGLHLRSFKWW